MASLSPAGERAILALVAEQYDTIVNLREALSLEQARRAEDLQHHEAELAELRHAAADTSAPSPPTEATGTQRGPMSPLSRYL